MTDTPKLLRDMTDAEIGALVRAHGEGKTIEYWSGHGYWETCYSDEAIFQPHEAYRVMPEPRRVWLVEGPYGYYAETREQVDEVVRRWEGMYSSGNITVTEFVETNRGEPEPCPVGSVLRSSFWGQGGAPGEIWYP